MVTAQSTETAVESEDGSIRVVVGVQLYVVATYLAAAIVPYAWLPRPYPPTWLLVVPAWLLGVPGFYVTALGPFVAIPLALVSWGLVAPVMWRYRLKTGLRVWCVVAIVLTTAFAVFSVTPLAGTIQSFVMD